MLITFQESALLLRESISIDDFLLWGNNYSAKGNYPPEKDNVE
jgi:hypothetical protein